MTNELSIIKKMQIRQEEKRYLQKSELTLEERYTNTLSEGTKQMYMSTIRNFFGVHSLNEIKQDDIVSVTVDMANAWAKYMYEEEKLSVATINNKLGAMCNFYGYLCRKSVGIMQYNPFCTSEGCVRYKNTKNYSDHRTLSEEEIIALVSYKADSTKLEDVRNRVIILMLVTMGLRRAELVSIKINHIVKEFGRYMVTIVGKGNKARKLEIAPQVYVVLRQYLTLRGINNLDNNGWLFISHAQNATGDALSAQSVRLVLKKVAKECGLKNDDIHPHMLRHTYATTIYMDSMVDGKTLQDLMGHSSMNTTNRYINASKSIANSPATALAKTYML